MSHSVKVNDENYNQLQALMLPRETYNDVVTRLLLVNKRSWELASVLEGGIRFRERQLEALRTKE